MSAVCAGEVPAILDQLYVRSLKRRPVEGRKSLRWHHGRKCSQQRQAQDCELPHYNHHLRSTGKRPKRCFVPPQIKGHANVNGPAKEPTVPQRISPNLRSAWLDHRRFAVYLTKREAWPRIGAGPPRLDRCPRPEAVVSMSGQQRLAPVFYARVRPVSLASLRSRWPFDPQAANPKPYVPGQTGVDIKMKSRES